MSQRQKIIIHDVVAIALAWILALFASFDFHLPPQDFLIRGVAALPLVMVFQGFLGWRFGLYRGVWRFASTEDLWNIIRASAVGALWLAFAFFLYNRSQGIPRSLLILYPFFLVFQLGGARLLYRGWKDYSGRRRHSGKREKVGVVGGGSAGNAIIRDMFQEGNLDPIFIVDDDRTLKNSRIRGVPVLGTIDDISRLVQKFNPDSIIIAIPSANNAEMERIVAFCRKTDKPFRTLPQLSDIISGHATVRSIREVSIDDLLGRDKVMLDEKLISSQVTGRTVLITGGGGSIGSELCRQLASLPILRLVVFERNEHHLYEIERELRDFYPHLNLHCVLGDICDVVAVRDVFETYRPDVVLHAAAYKHVPMLQSRIREAVRNNVLGTVTVADAADSNGCDVFTLISTDKAVHPSSVMGATKRLAELLCMARNKRSSTNYLTVRFGNVLDSAGSVVPLFRQQIAAGGPVTVTDANASRYFMTIPEACQLILQAGAVGGGGEIFVLDMGEPINIKSLAERMIELSGRVLGEDIDIVFTGLRSGEKLTEELFHAAEHLSSTEHKKLFLARHTEVSPYSLDALVREMVQATDAYQERVLEGLLRQAVPELVRNIPKSNFIGEKKRSRA